MPILLLLLVFAAGSGAEVDAADALDLQEARALVLAPLQAGIPWGAYAALPKEARGMLVEMLDQPDPLRQANAIRMLGYVGSSADIDRILGLVEAAGGWNPAVADMDRELFMAVMDCVGVAARMPGQSPLLDRALRLAMADVPRTRWFPEEVLTAKPDVRFEPLVILVEGYALSNDPAATLQVANAVRTVLERNSASTLAWRLTADRLKRRAEIVAEAERGGMRPVDRELIQAIQAREGARAVERKSVGISGQVDQIGGMVEAALAVYAQGAKAFRSGELSTVADRLADNRRPWIDVPQPGPEDIRRAIERLQRNPGEIAREAAILEDVFATGPKMGPARIQHRQAMTAVETARGSGSYRIQMEEEIGIVIELEGTAALVTKHRLSASSPTVGPDGLRLLFIFRHNRWMWTPFGW